MKKIKILMILIGAILLCNCTTTKYKNIHVDLDITQTCIFQPYTESEKDSMSESVGKKTYSNQQECLNEKEKNHAIIQAHNELHEGQ